jgi:uncharacterized protein YecT (DUF1311 family)
MKSGVGSSAKKQRLALGISYALGTVFLLMSAHARAEFRCPDDVRATGSEWCDVAELEEKKTQLDKRLNDVYSALLKQYKGQNREAWVKAERAWISFFQAHCNAIAFHTAEGSNATKQFTYLSCLNDEIKKRTDVLQSFCEAPNCK